MNQPTVLRGACRLMLSDRVLAVDQGISLVAAVRTKADATHVWLRGDIDLANRDVMIDELTPFFDAPARVIRVDLSAVTLIDASGIGSCLKVREQARTCGCDLVFANPRGLVARVIKVLGLETVLLEADHRG